MIQLIVFLGNPGKEYERTRHNAGFMVAEELERRLGTFTWNKKGEALYCPVNVGSRRVYLCRPDNYMNNSGRAVRTLMDFYKLDANAILAVYDDLETGFGTLRVRKGGGAAGHNGIRSMDSHCGSSDYARLKIGIGRPQRGDVSSWVLSRFSPDDEAVLPLVLEQGANMVLELSAMDDAALTRTLARTMEKKAFQGA